MDMQIWLEKHGTPALQRALREDYDVAPGVAGLIFDMWEQASRVPLLRSWDSTVERKAPHARSFELLDAISLAKPAELPPDYSLGLGRICRISVDGELTTGVLAHVRAPGGHVYVRAFDFEGELPP